MILLYSPWRSCIIIIIVIILSNSIVTIGSLPYTSIVICMISIAILSNSNVTSILPSMITCCSRYWSNPPFSKYWSHICTCCTITSSNLISCICYTCSTSSSSYCTITSPYLRCSCTITSTYLRFTIYLQYMIHRRSFSSF